MLPPFCDLVDLYWRDVARLCNALAGPDEGADAAQRAWLNALRAYPSLRHDRNLKGWLLTIASRTAIDVHRDRARRPVPVDVVPDRPTAAPGDVDPEADHSLWRLVAALPERQRLAVGMRYALDLPHSEIAETIGCSESMSRRLVSDGLATLRTQLAADGTGTDEKGDFR